MVLGLGVVGWAVVGGFKVVVMVGVVVVVMGGAGPDHVNHPGPIKEGNDMSQLLTSLQTRLILLCPTTFRAVAQTEAAGKYLKKRTSQEEKKMEDDQKD